MKTFDLTSSVVDVPEVKGGHSMTEREMFEKSFERPTNYFELSPEGQWAIDKKLGILDWKGEGLTKADRKRFYRHYN